MRGYMDSRGRFVLEVALFLTSEIVCLINVSTLNIYVYLPGKLIELIDFHTLPNLAHATVKRANRSNRIFFPFIKPTST